MSSKSSRWSEFTLRRRVTFHEVDGAGIVHFSNFFRYMEEAEHALWRAAGLSIARREAQVGFPRVAASFEFQRPLRFEDEFDIRIQVAAMSEKSMRYRCTLTRGEERVATGGVTVVCVVVDESGQMKAVPLPKDVAGRFEAVPEGDA
jgi:YbgC/YbaW family acyl-CoA thioester hydrolase